jgi:RimJ/RimL family protein N-acetyltransferase
LLNKLAPSEYASARALLAPLDYNLCILSFLAGQTPGQLYTDHATHPASAFVYLGHHIFLAGAAENQPFNTSVRQLFQRVILPHNRAAGKDVFMLHFDHAGWLPAAEDILAGLYPLRRTRQYFECSQRIQDWRPLIPPGFILQPVSAELVSQSQLQHIDYLREELCSERPTIADFLEKSFGFVIQHENDLASWCLSEYNTNQRCEVGVATVDAYQKRGLATITSLALVEHALSQGTTRIGWHCWRWNTPSAALARKSGFVHQHDYPVLLCILDSGVQLAMHGYDAQYAGNISLALEWYQKALSTGSAPTWAYYNMARCLAREGQPAPALAALNQAVSHGFTDFDAMRSEPDLENIRTIPGWDTIIAG